MVKKNKMAAVDLTYFQHNYITKYYIFSSENNFTLKCNVKPNVLKFTFTFKLHCANILAAIGPTLNVSAVQHGKIQLFNADFLTNCCCSCFHCRLYIHMNLLKHGYRLSIHV